MLGVYQLNQEVRWSREFFAYLSLSAFGISALLAFFLLEAREKLKELKEEVSRLEQELLVATDH